METMEEAPMTALSAVDMMAASVEQVITVTKTYCRGPGDSGPATETRSAGVDAKRTI